MTTSPTEDHGWPAAAATGAAPAPVHTPHPYLALRAGAGPVKAAEQLLAGGALARLSTRLGVKITGIVGTMWCAYVFAALSLISLPAAIKGGVAATVQWTAQEFLQLVLLSIIMVGQRVASAAGDARARATFDDGEAILHYVDGHAKNLAHLRAELEQGLAHLHDRLDKDLGHVRATLDAGVVVPPLVTVPPAPTPMPAEAPAVTAPATSAPPDPAPPGSTAPTTPSPQPSPPAADTSGSASTS